MHNSHKRRRPSGISKAPGKVPGKNPPDAPGVESSPSRGERLQKVLAAAGIASRRECEELIQAGRVEIDRRTVTLLGTRVDPLSQEIRVDGVTLPQPKKAYFLLNKPPGVVCTNHDPSGRTRVIDLIRSDLRLFPVGRLDRTTEGLILVTNDGALANRLTHPRYGIEKTYLARCEGHLNQHDFDRLRRGVRLAEGLARVESIKLKKRNLQSSDLIIVLKEGRNREIRRLLASVGHKVLQLRRTAIGPIRIEDMPLGAYRKMLPEEVQLLEHAARDAKRSKKRRPLSADDPQLSVEETAPGDQAGVVGRPNRQRPSSARSDRTAESHGPAGRTSSPTPGAPRSTGRTGNRTPGGRTPTGRTDGRTPGSRAPTGRTDSRTATGRTGGQGRTGSRTPGARTPTGRTGSRTPGARTPTGRTGSRTSGARTPTGRTDSRTPSARTPTGRIGSRTPGPRTTENRAGNRSPSGRARRGSPAPLGNRFPRPVSKEHQNRALPRHPSPDDLPE